MSDKIRMTHPELPESVIHARPAQVAVREKSGWVVSADEVAEAAPAPDAATAASATKPAARTVPAATQES